MPESSFLDGYCEYLLTRVPLACERLRAQVDAAEREPAELPVEEVPLDPVGQRRH
jgi:hypothetical protein